MNDVFSSSDGEVSERTLTVINYGTDDEEDENGVVTGTGRVIKTRVTLAPGMIQVVIASEEPALRLDGREQYKVNILFVDSNRVELFITLLDLTTLERATGAYFLP